jgi:hypothetical protein
MPNVLRATVAGSAALAGAQVLDMRLTHRPPSDAPERLIAQIIRRPLPGWARTGSSYLSQSTIPLTIALMAELARLQTFSARLRLAVAVSLGAGTVVDPALGVCDLPWRWSRSDWVREVGLKSSLAIATAAAL